MGRNFTERKKKPLKETRIIVELHKQIPRNSFMNSIDRLKKLRDVYKHHGCEMLVLLALRNPIELYRSLFCYAFSTRKWKNRAPPFSWRNAFCCLGKDLQSWWLTSAGWPTNHGFLRGLKSGADTKIVEAVKSVVDLVITPQSQPSSFSKILRAVHESDHNCTFTHRNHKPCRDENKNNTPNNFYTCKDMNTFCPAVSSQWPSSNLKLNRGLRSPLGNEDIRRRVGLIDFRVWEALSSKVGEEPNTCPQQHVL